jgi:hypothetical protein
MNTIEDLRRWAERCEQAGRLGQASYVRSLANEVEFENAPWLVLMDEWGVRVPEEERPS